MGKLIAARPVLYRNRQYAPGEALPAWDGAMAAAWLAAGSAIRVEISPEPMPEAEEPPEPAPVAETPPEPAPEAREKRRSR